ncbi:MAG: ribosomal-protein-alanine N-acetyltransferase [Litorivivens sp.]|jgi:ribosomal-protein-alanine N-acetyltransferase
MDYFNQESERLKFRKLTEADIPSWIEFFIDNDKLKFLGMNLAKSEEALAEDWIRAQLARYKNQGLGHLAVELKEGGDFIGMGGIIPREVNGNQEYEIAYSFKPQYWGHGYATETARAMREFGTKNIKASRFISIIDVANIESNKVALKNGMEVLFSTEYLGMNVNVFGIDNGLQQ